jgi:predicted aconitase with swiveling domain
MAKILQGHGVGEGLVEGEAVVTRQMISNDYIGPMDGIYREKGHELDGEKVGGKILVFPAGKGSSVVAHSLMLAKSLGGAPVGMIFERANTIQVQSVLLAQVPAVYSLKESLLESIQTGQKVKIDAGQGAVEIL